MDLSSEHNPRTWKPVPGQDYAKSTTESAHLKPSDQTALKVNLPVAGSCPAERISPASSSSFLPFDQFQSGLSKGIIAQFSFTNGAFAGNK
jgi:hypothetical protein